MIMEMSQLSEECKAGYSGESELCVLFSAEKKARYVGVGVYELDYGKEGGD